MEKELNEAQVQQELRDAGSCLAMGAGVGTVGTASAILLGATCPICIVMAPALIGMGLFRGYAARKKRDVLRGVSAIQSQVCVPVERCEVPSADDVRDGPSCQRDVSENTSGRPLFRHRQDLENNRFPS